MNRNRSVCDRKTKHFFVSEHCPTWSVDPGADSSDKQMNLKSNAPVGWWLSDLRHWVIRFISIYWYVIISWGKGFFYLCWFVLVQQMLCICLTWHILSSVFCLAQSMSCDILPLWALELLQSAESMSETWASIRYRERESVKKTQQRNYHSQLLLSKVT